MKTMKEQWIRLYEKMYTTNVVIGMVFYLYTRRIRSNILTSEQTIRRILETGCSIARFGDGEFELVLDPQIDLGFQKRNAVLADRLREVLANRDPNLLICVPYTFRSIRGRTEHSRKFWYSWARRNDQLPRAVELMRRLQPEGYTYGDSQITRPYIAFNDSGNARRIFPLLKQLWQDCDILIVEGEKTRLGVGNDLLSGARSIRRILCPATDAFDRYDEILQTVKDHWNGERILLALGPTATVLAADLAAAGMQALDVGHMDIEYEWFLSGAKEHTQVRGKYTNEAANREQVDDCGDDLYCGQILCRIAP